MIAALLLAIACTPDLATFSPTPVVLHNPSSNTNIAGHSLYYREPGGTFQKLIDWPCDLDDRPGGAPVTTCRAVDLGAPLQRYCSACASHALYEFTVRAYDVNGNYSADSNRIQVCMPLMAEITP